MAVEQAGRADNDVRPTDRTNTVALSAADAFSYGQFRGDLARFQLQINY
jgi:hypothetical protein